MARNNDRNRILAVCRADRTGGFWVADLIRNLTVRSRFAERNGDQRRPNLFLKVSASHIERHGKSFSFTREIFVQLFLSAKQCWVRRILNKIGKMNGPRAIAIPQNRRQSLIAGDKSEPSDRGGNDFARQAHECSSTSHDAAEPKSMFRSPLL